MRKRSNDILTYIESPTLRLALSKTCHYRATYATREHAIAKSCATHRDCDANNCEALYGALRAKHGGSLCTYKRNGNLQSHVNAGCKHAHSSTHPSRLPEMTRKIAKA